MSKEIISDNDPFTEPSFSLKNRAARALWATVYVLLFKTSPRPFHAWRSFLLTLFGAKLGHSVHIYPSVKIWAPWNLVIGDRVGVGDGANLYSMARIVVGNDVVISQGSHICTGTHDINSANFQLVAKEISIGSSAWICAEAFVGPGVSLAEGVVVGARAVVTRSVEDEFSVWVGNPAFYKKSRKRIEV